MGNIDGAGLTWGIIGFTLASGPLQQVLIEIRDRTLNGLKAAFGPFTPQLLQAEAAAPATINRELAGLRRAFALAVESGTLALAPKFPSLPEHNTRQGFFERDEFEAVVAYLPVYLWDFARFGYLTGWRKGEIASLTWADVDRSGRTLRLRPEASKTGQG